MKIPVWHPSITEAEHSAVRRVLEVGYLGTQGHRLERLMSYNLPYPSPTGSIASREPAPEFGNIQMLAGFGNGPRHVCQLPRFRSLLR